CLPHPLDRRHRRRCRRRSGRCPRRTRRRLRLRRRTGSRHRGSRRDPPGCGSGDVQRHLRPEHALRHRRQSTDLRPRLCGGEVTAQTHHRSLSVRRAQPRPVDTGNRLLTRGHSGRIGPSGGMTAARSAAANTDADTEVPSSTGPGRRLHPATEIIVLSSGLVLVFGIPSPAVPAVIIVASCCAAGLSTTVSLRSWAVGVAVVCLPSLLVLVLVQGFFYPGAQVHVLWEYGPAGLTVEGLIIAVQIWLRVTSLVGLCAVFGLGTDAARLFDGLRRLRLPVGAAYVSASVIGLIPLVVARTRQV